MFRLFHLAARLSGAVRCQMTLTERIAASIEALPQRNRSGSLQVWGEWFGRPMDNVHTCVSCTAGADHIVMSFDGGERLTVWKPDVHKARGFTLRIPSASRVRWEWFYFGRPRSVENLLFNDYVRAGDSIRRTSNAPWPSSNEADSKFDAVNLVGL